MRKLKKKATDNNGKLTGAAGIKKAAHQKSPGTLINLGNIRVTRGTLNEISFWAGSERPTALKAYIRNSYRIQTMQNLANTWNVSIFTAHKLCHWAGVKVREATGRRGFQYKPTRRKEERRRRAD